SRNQIEHENYRKTTDSFERLQILKKMMNFNEIMEYFKKAVNYEFQPEPAAIIFTYPNGVKEKYIIEATDEFSKVFKEIERQHRQRKKEKQTEKETHIEEVYDNLTGKVVEEGDREIEEEHMKRLNTAWQQKTEDIIHRSQYLNTPETAYEELKNIAPSLSDDLLEQLSVPCSEIADVWSQAEVNYEEESYRQLDNYDGTRIFDNFKKLIDIMRNHYGENWQEELNGQEKKDINEISFTFRIE
ncbi:hypothetical protein ACFL6I_23220, partial [candidate division KSB1 bacterium]